MSKVKCPNCGHEFEIEEDDLDIDYDIEKIEEKNVELTITVTLRCPKCGRKVLQGTETTTISLKARSEI